MQRVVPWLGRRDCPSNGREAGSPHRPGFWHRCWKRGSCQCEPTKRPVTSRSEQSGERDTNPRVTETQLTAAVSGSLTPAPCVSFCVERVTFYRAPGRIAISLIERRDMFGERKATCQPHEGKGGPCSLFSCSPWGLCPSAPRAQGCQKNSSALSRLQFQRPRAQRRRSGCLLCPQTTISTGHCMRCPRSPAPRQSGRATCPSGPPESLCEPLPTPPRLLQQHKGLTRWSGQPVTTVLFGPERA